MSRRLLLLPCLTVIVFLLSLPIVGSGFAATILFDARMDYHNSQQNTSVDAADLDGDGLTDLALVTGGFAAVMLGRGDGTFEEEVRYWVGELPETVAIGDLDLDGTPDLALGYRGTASSSFAGGVAVLLGNGDGTFGNDEKYPAGNNSRVVALGDLNEDGTPDVALSFFGDYPDQGGIAVFLGAGDGTLDDAVLLTAGDQPAYVAIGDADGDGHPDLAAANLESDDVSVLWGNGDGSFQSAEQFTAGEGPGSIAIRDLDGDGAPDLAVSNAWSDDASVLLGNGDRTFQTAQHYPAGYNPQTVSVGDLDNDGHPDLAVANYVGNSVAVLLANGDGTFQAADLHWVSSRPQSGLTVDLNGDDYPDLVTANFGEFPGNIGSTSILLGIGDGTFRTAPGYDTGEFPNALAAGDLNLDGAADLAVAFRGASSPEESGISILLNNGGGAFVDRMNILIGTEFSAVAAGDLDLDGDPDLVCASQYSDDLSVFLGNGDGTFQDADSYPAGDNTNFVAISDLNSDGAPDLATTNSGDDSVSIFLGNGDGSFQSAVDHYCGYLPVSLAIDDLNRDGIPDLAAAGLDSELFVLLGNGDASFQDPVSYGAGYYPSSIALGDLNGDGDPDVAVANQYDDNVSVRLGAGDGTFGPETTYGVDDHPFSVAIGTVSTDAYPDLVTANFTGNNISVLIGNGDGTFGELQNYGAGGLPRYAVIEDLDGDSDPDLAVASSGSHQASVLLNNTFTGQLVVVGPGPGPDNRPLVRGFPPRQSATHIHEFQAYGPDRYGTNVCCGDVNGDAVIDILTGPGPGEIYGPHVRGFQEDGTPLPGLSFLAYGTNKYGVKVAVGDLDNDGYDEVITGAGPGAVFGPHVRGWDYDGTSAVTPVPGVSYFAYGTPKWGVNVACGDIDGDGYDEIITGAGPGAVYGPHVRGWNVDGGTAVAMPEVNYFAYGTLKFGVNVTCGDLDGDGIDEIVTGAGPGAVFGPHVRGWNYDGDSVVPLPGYSFFAWDTPPLRFGVNVSSGVDLNDNGMDELVVGRGPDPESDTEVKLFTYDGATVNQWISLDAFEDLSHGVNVAAGRS